jgi:hypothetical protein
MATTHTDVKCTVPPNKVVPVFGALIDNTQETWERKEKQVAKYDYDDAEYRDTMAYLLLTNPLLLAQYEKICEDERLEKTMIDKMCLNRFDFLDFVEKSGLRKLRRLNQLAFNCRPYQGAGFGGVWDTLNHSFKTVTKYSGCSFPVEEEYFTAEAIASAKEWALSWDKMCAKFKH